MAKPKKLPKTPKQSASLETWKKHKEKIVEVRKFNDQLAKDKSAKKALIVQVRKMRGK